MVDDSNLSGEKRSLPDRIDTTRRSFLKLASVGAATAGLGGVAVDSVAAIPDEQADISKEDALADIDYDLEHPRVYHTPGEVELARENAANTDWGANIKEQAVDLADGTPYIEMSDEDFASIMPVKSPDGKTYFSYPFETFSTLPKGLVSPVDGSALSLAGYDQPGKVEDESGNVFPGTVDGVEITDEGDGWVLDPDEVPSDWEAAKELDEPTTFWFVAEYNAHLFETFVDFLEPIAYAYALTEETKYARTTAQIIDVISTVTPTSFNRVVGRGPYGWLPTGYYPALLYRDTYVVPRIMDKVINAGDLVWPSGELDVASPTNDGVTIKENFAENFAIETGHFCWDVLFAGTDQHPTDANYSRLYFGGTSDLNIGVLEVSSLLGLDVGYTEWSLDGQVSLKNFVDNKTFRDGHGTATSSLYSGGADLEVLQWASVASRLRNEAYPDGYEAFDNEKMELNVLGASRQAVANRIPHYGDVFNPDVGVDTTPERGSFTGTLKLYSHATDEEEKRLYANELATIAGGDPNSRLEDQNVSTNATRDGMWPLFNIDTAIDGFDLPVENEARESEILPACGMGMLRPEVGTDRGAMLRYGSTLQHGHLDCLGLWIFGANRELSFDPGRKPQPQYKPSFLGQTVAHNTTVVNENSQLLDLSADDAGDLNFFGNRSGYSVVDVSNTNVYAHEDIDEYRRTAALIDTSDSQSYLFDVFRVAGAERSDYAFHGKGVHFDTDLDLSEPAKGSIASEDYFWGDKVKTTGHIEGKEDEGRSWTAPPGNGYGFLGHPRSASGDETFSAEWKVDENRGPPAKMRLTMLPENDRKVVVAEGPDDMVRDINRLSGVSLDTDEHHVQFLLARDDSSTSQFAGVIEPVAEQYPVASVEPLDVPGHGGAQFDPIAAEVSLGDGRTDYVLSTLEGEQFMAKVGRSDQLNTDAEFATVRVDAEGVQRVRMERGSHIHVKLGGGKPLVVDAETDEYTGSILSIDYENSSLLVDAPLPTGDELEGQNLIVSEEDYAHNAPYVVKRVETEGNNFRVHLEETTTVLSRGTIQTVNGNTLLSPVNFPLSQSESPLGQTEESGFTANRFFDGRLLVNRATGETTVVKDTLVDDGAIRGLEVIDGSVFSEGDTFEILEIKSGDSCRVPLSVEVRREGNEYVVDGPEGVATNQ